MATSKGFSLMEIIVVLVIVGIAAAMALPNFVASMEQTKAQAAQNNLYAIAAAEEKYFEDSGNITYCGAGPCTWPTTNTSLRLSLADNFTYSCTLAPIAGFASDIYQCFAIDGSDTLRLDYTTAGGALVTCAASPGPGYCP